VAEIERVILESYGRPAAELFEWFDQEPLAAASLGQVHRARLAGEDVVIKVLRPGVERLVAEDVRVALGLTRLLERWAPSAHARTLRTSVEQFALRVHEEMDFRQEAANAEAVRANFAGNRSIAIPRIVPELVRRRTLVMQYMEGTKIDALDAQVATHRLDPGLVVRRVMELYMQMMLVDGLFHADPHPGNLLVAPDGTLVLLDFGMVVRVPVGTRRALVRTAFAGIRRDVEAVTEGFHALGLVAPGADRDRIRTLVELLFTVADSRSTATERAQLLADEVMANLYDFPVELPGEMVYFARTAALIEGVGVRYDPRFNAALFATPVALRMRSRIVASLDMGGEPVTNDLAGLLGGALGAVARIVVRAGREIAGVLQERAVLGREP
jgi:predicted unusual protein kinase regulating ubiquinone biosynthesis (AarF/ABC1/UbiB family)